MGTNRKIITGAIVWLGVFIGGFSYDALAVQSIPNDKPVIIANPKEPVPPAGQRKKIVFKEELTIGNEEAGENYLFEKNICAIADEKGFIYVVNNDRRRIQKYDATGKYLFSVGRQGQGPGEFITIWAPGFDGKGHIYANDNLAHRIILFDKEDGRYQGQIMTDKMGGEVSLLPNGKYFSCTTTKSNTGSTLSFTTVYGIYGKDFMLQTELHRRFWENENRSRDSRAQRMARIASTAALKPYISSILTNDGRIITANPAAREIKIYDGHGKVLMIIRKDAKPKPVSDAHKNFYFETVVMDFLSGNENQYMSLKDDVRKAMTYPQFLPAFCYCRPMDNGWLFVVEDSLPESSWIDLFDNKGIYVGRFETNIPVYFLTFANGKAYTVADIDGSKYVKRYGYSIQNY
jgi:hypothetical protein